MPPVPTIKDWIGYTPSAKSYNRSWYTESWVGVEKEECTKCGNILAASWERRRGTCTQCEYPDSYTKQTSQSCDGCDNKLYPWELNGKKCSVCRYGLPSTQRSLLPIQHKPAESKEGHRQCRECQADLLSSWDVKEGICTQCVLSKKDEADEECPGCHTRLLLSELEKTSNKCCICRYTEAKEPKVIPICSVCLKSLKQHEEAQGDCDDCLRTSLWSVLDFD